MSNKRYHGKTLAFKKFKEAIWKTESLIELGVVGIDEKVSKTYGGILDKFEGVKGVPGPKPKKYKPKIDSEKKENGNIEVKMDARSAAFLKKVVENARKRHDELRFFLYSNIFVSVWGAFETYSQMLFEELLLTKPEMLKSKETILLEDVVSNRNSIIEHLVEKQVEAIGHFKIDELLTYFNKKINISLSITQSKKLTNYYFIRNVIAHKSGIIRGSQTQKIPTGIKVVNDEIQISDSYLNRMISTIEKTVISIEKKVESKFYNKT